VVVSQDGNHAKTTNAIQSYGDKVPFNCLNHFSLQSLIITETKVDEITGIALIISFVECTSTKMGQNMKNDVILLICDVIN